MKVSKVILTILVLCSISAASLSCASESDPVIPENQVVTVQRGDLTIDITAVGNLAFSHQEELTFEVGGTIREVPVEVGDSVEEGRVIAKLDDTSIISLEKAVIQARINLKNAEAAEGLAVTQTEAAVVDARIALEAAEEALKNTEYTESDIARAELAVINAEIALDRAQGNFERAEEKYNWNWTVPAWILEYEQKTLELAIAEFDLAEAEETLVEMMAGADPLEVEQKQKQLAVAQANLREAEAELANMLDVAQKQSEVVSAQNALDEAIEQLEMATMIAPFAGIVTSVNAEVGEAVNANQVVIELVDPDKFEVEILVSELDIFNIRLGAQATVQVDSVSGISFPANVTFISPTATIQSGVVNYKVKVEIQSLEAIMREREGAMPGGMPGMIPGELPEPIRQAIEEGRITQEQAEEMIKQRQQGQEGAAGPMPRMIPEDLQLREGLTVTVSILVEERKDVLLVPNGAIIRQGGETLVQVMEDGITTERSIKTGISNWQYTEVTDGLSEGEKVVIPQGTTATPTTPAPRGMMIPGMGRR